MRKPGKRGTMIAVLGCAGALGVAGVALAADPIIAEDTLSYKANNYNMAQGESLTFLNQDSPTNPHNVIARAKLGGKPLFSSINIVGPAGSAPVKGTQYLTQGSYDFFCSVHPDMQATLHVSGAGTPVARPDIEVKVLSGKIGKVANSRKARVKVTAATLSNDVVLTLKLGRTRLGSKANIDLAAGQSRTVTLKLSRQAKNKLSRRNKAKVKLLGSVPFGAGDTASKLLS